MVMTCILLSRYRAQPPTNVESKSLRLKYQLLAINMVSFALAGYFFIRHNLYCEPGGKFYTVYMYLCLLAYIKIQLNDHEIFHFIET